MKEEREKSLKKTCFFPPSFSKQWGKKPATSTLHPGQLLLRLLHRLLRPPEAARRPPPRQRRLRDRRFPGEVRLRGAAAGRGEDVHPRRDVLLARGRGDVGRGGRLRAWRVPDRAAAAAAAQEHGRLCERGRGCGGGCSGSCSPRRCCCSRGCRRRARRRPGGASLVPGGGRGRRLFAEVGLGRRRFRRRRRGRIRQRIRARGDFCRGGREEGKGTRRKRRLKKKKTKTKTKKENKEEENILPLSFPPHPSESVFFLFCYRKEKYRIRLDKEI